jgi:hypothetical protein
MNPSTDAADLIRACIGQARRLRATGPTTIDYLRWREQAEELLTDLLGAEHTLRLQFHSAVGPFDPLDAEGLQIEGEHGMRVRIQRGTGVLQAILGEPHAAD